MERIDESAAEVAGRATGQLVSHLVPFVTSLIDQQYAASIIYIKARHALAFDRWLAKRGVVLADLGEVHIERYQRRSRRRHRPICSGTVIAHPDGSGGRAAGKCNPFKVRRMAWRAPMVRRLAVSMTDLMSA